jgi:hypothetical protein
MTEQISMDSIIKMVHELAGFKADTSRVDAFRVVLEAHAAQLAQSYVTSPSELTEAHLNSLLSLASQLLDPATVRLRDGEELLSRADLAPVLAKLDETRLTVANGRLAASDRTTEILGRLEDLDSYLGDRFASVQAQLDALTRTAVAQVPPYVHSDDASGASQMIPTGNGLSPRDEAIAESLQLIARLQEEGREKMRAPSAPGCFFEPDGTITCRDCGEAKSPADYYKDKQAWTGRKSACKACEQARKVARRPNPVF